MVRLKRSSLIKRIIFRLSFLIGILVVVLIISYLYALNIVKRNTVDLSSNTIAIYTNDITNSLINMSKSLDEIAFNTSEIANLNSATDSEVYFTSIDLDSLLDAKINYANDADAYFIVNTINHLILCRYGNRVSNLQNVQIHQYLQITDIPARVKTQNQWTLIKIGDTHYYTKYYNISGNYVGIIVSTDTLMSYVEQTVQTKESGYILTDDKGDYISSAGISLKGILDGKETLPNGSHVVDHFNHDYMIITGPIDECGARLSNIIIRKSFFQGMTFIQWMIILLVLLSLFLVIGISMFLNKEVIQPVLGLIIATRGIKYGNLEQQVNYSVSSKEMDILKNSFNLMVHEIKSLKIHSYEEKIDRQKAELKYLQMQIRPHFYLNALTTIHSMTYKDKNKEIRSFIEELSDHLRYTLREGLSKVTINEELEHTEGYIKMQEIKFPNSVFFVPDLNASMKDYLIPQFLILTFVENSFKHAMTLNCLLSILLQVREIKTDDKKFLQIVLEDNGIGFPKDVIQDINSNQVKNGDSSGKKIGINNVKRTLSLLYGNESTLKLSNCETSGARVEITIPIKEAQINETPDC